jgi:hypothetical protein
MLTNDPFGLRLAVSIGDVGLAATAAEMFSLTTNCLAGDVAIMLLMQ